MVRLPVQTPPALTDAMPLVVLMSLVSLVVWGGLVVAMNLTVRFSDEPPTICVPGAGGLTNCQLFVSESVRPLIVRARSPVLLIVMVLVLWTTSGLIVLGTLRVLKTSVLEPGDV